MGEHGSNEPVSGSGAESDSLGELIRSAGKRPLPRPGDVERVRSATRAAWQAAVQARRRRRRVVAFAAAASVAVVATGIATVTVLRPPVRVGRVAVLMGRAEVRAADAGHWTALTTNGGAVFAGTRVRTVAGGRAAFNLAGISVRVDSGSRLTLVSPARIDLQGGRIYVDSGRGDRHKGLVITTAFGTVKDVGTQFEVRALTSGLRLRVREGRVNLQRSAQRRDLQAVAGQQLLLGRNGHVERGKFAPDDPAWRWAEALAAPLRIDGQSAFDVLRWAARESGRRLVFEDPDAELRARNAILSGGHDMSLTPAQAMRIAAATSGGLQARFGNGTLVVRSR